MTGDVTVLAPGRVDFDRDRYRRDDHQFAQPLQQCGGPGGIDDQN